MTARCVFFVLPRGILAWCDFSFCMSFIGYLIHGRLVQFTWMTTVECYKILFIIYSYYLLLLFSACRYPMHHCMDWGPLWTTDLWLDCAFLRLLPSKKLRIVRRKRLAFFKFHACQVPSNFQIPESTIGYGIAVDGLFYFLSFPFLPFWFCDNTPQYIYLSLLESCTR